MISLLGLYALDPHANVRVQTMVGTMKNEDQKIPEINEQIKEKKMSLMSELHPLPHLDLEK